MTLGEASPDDQQMMEQHPGLAEAEARIERLEVENQIWRELVAEVRDVACNLAPVVWHMQATERARQCMASDRRMAEEVDKRLAQIYERKAKVAAEEAARAAQAMQAAEEDQGGETDQG